MPSRTLKCSCVDVNMQACWHTCTLCRYLLYYCGTVPGLKVQEQYECRGTGDRLRGMLEILRLAAASNR